MVALIAVTLPFPALAAPPRPVTAPRPAPLPRWRKPVDPPPLITAEYLELSVARAKDGALRVLKLARHAFARPQAIAPRYRGRFEAKLYGPGGLLVDVIRFDFPLTGASDGAKGALDPLGASLARGVEARVLVRVPFDRHRTTALVLHDTGTRATTPVSLTAFLRPPAAPPPLDAGKLRTGTFRPPPKQ
jgi:hypothetical protein